MAYNDSTLYVVKKRQCVITLPYIYILLVSIQLLETALLGVPKIQPDKIMMVLASLLMQPNLVLQHRVPTL